MSRDPDSGYVGHAFTIVGKVYTKRAYGIYAKKQPHWKLAMRRAGKACKVRIPSLLSVDNRHGVDNTDQMG